jgi:PAS domain S-box-containing protein
LTTERVALFLDSVLDRTAEGIVLSDEDNNCLIFNKRMEEITGYSRQEMVGTAHFPASFFPDRAYRDRAMTCLTGAFDGRPVENSEWTITRRNGGRRITLWSTSLFQQGGQRWLLSAVRDITARRRAEQKKQCESLGLIGVEMARHIDRHLEELWHHARAAQTEGDSTRRRQQLAHLTESLCRLDTFVERLNRGAAKISLCCDHVNLSRLVDDLAPQWLRSVSDDVTLTVELAPDLPAVICNADHLNLVVDHLVRNAVEALAGEPGTVTIRTGLSRGISAQEGTYLAGGHGLEPHDERPFPFVEVIDNGPGMPGHSIEKAFEPMFSTKRRGCGLGLALVGGIVRSHHGAVQVKSGKEGTTVTVLLPPAH